MESIWSQTQSMPEKPFLPGNIEVEAAVIGGGMAGILTAWYLKEAGIDAVVLEADQIASGQTKNTTAKITAQHGLIYQKLIDSLGIDSAKKYANANLQAIKAYRDIIASLKIDCDFQELPSYIYSVLDAETLQEETKAAQKLGIPAEFTLQTSLPFPIKGAVCFSKQAQFHPLKFLSVLADQLDIYTQTRVQKVEDNRIQTNRGIVQAKYIVFTCHYPFQLTPGFYFMRMHQERSYVLALENAGQMNGMYLGIDPDGLSFRHHGDFLLLGGGGHRTGENRMGGRYDTLRQVARKFWPESLEKGHWSAQDCMPLDGVPYIGQFAASVPNWYVATGFGKWGMTSSMVAALGIRDLITGHKNPDLEVFSPQRFTPAASAGTFLDNSLHAVRDLSRRILAPPREELDALPNGHGGIVEYQGEKVGVYKDETGKVFAVSIKCPHLGCQLEWNPDEKSWDCPCHGSRFDYHGRLLDDPAQEGLQHV
ncbi:MAG TPA: FAD-dependent oxidoreductase [Firmicutes bacterium]|nr:FAD-dependent oxidoreductase [Bacillota bacterium]